MVHIYYQQCQVMFNNVGKGLKRHFNKGDANKHMKRHSPSPVPGKCKSKPQRHTTSHLLGCLVTESNRESEWMWRHVNICTLLVGMENGAASVGNS